MFLPLVYSTKSDVASYALTITEGQRAMNSQLDELKEMVVVLQESIDETLEEVKKNGDMLAAMAKKQQGLEEDIEERKAGVTEVFSRFQHHGLDANDNGVIETAEIFDAFDDFGYEYSGVAKVMRLLRITPMDFASLLRSLYSSWPVRGREFIRLTGLVSRRELFLPACLLLLVSQCLALARRHLLLLVIALKFV